MESIYMDNAVHDDHHTEQTFNINHLTPEELLKIVSRLQEDAEDADFTEEQPADEGQQTAQTRAKSTEQSSAEASRLGERLHENKRVNSNLCVSDDEAPSKENKLCIALNKHQREILNAAVKEGIIVYNPERKGYDTGHQSSNVLVAYLCGRLSCGDYTSEDGTWIDGGRFDEAKYYKELFGFDVDGTRRKARGKGAGKSPTGHERVDKLFK